MDPWFPHIANYELICGLLEIIIMSIDHVYIKYVVESLYPLYNVVIQEVTAEFNSWPWRKNSVVLNMFYEDYV